MSERRAYLEANPVCELMAFEGVIHGGFDRYHDRRPVDPHHICGGKNQRHDDHCNLISVCRQCHDAIQHTITGMLFCVVAKHRKGELDLVRLSEMRGKSVGYWLWYNVPDEFRWLLREIGIDNP